MIRMGWLTLFFWISLITSPMSASSSLLPCAAFQQLPLKTHREVSLLEASTQVPPKITPGDLLNIVITTPSQTALEKAFLQAQWSKPALFAYLEAPWKHADEFPVSALYLWGRPQDLAFSRNTSLTLSHRNHLRLWKTPWSCEGQEIWVGSATQDIAIEESIWGWRSGLTTHRISPQVDQERDLVLASLASQGARTYHVQRNTLKLTLSGYNGNLDPYLSDGRLGWIHIER
jgi:hypothetical protein